MFIFYHGKSWPRTRMVRRVLWTERNGPAGPGLLPARRKCRNRGDRRQGRTLQCFRIVLSLGLQQVSWSYLGCKRNSSPHYGFHVWSPESANIWMINSEIGARCDWPCQRNDLRVWHWSLPALVPRSRGVVAPGNVSRRNSEPASRRWNLSIADAIFFPSMEVTLMP